MQPPYHKTKSVLINALLATAHWYSATNIIYQNGVLEFVVNGKQRSLPVTPDTCCLDVIALIHDQDVDHA